MKSDKGFSLIEVIVVLSIIAVIGIISTTITSRVFRSNTQNKDISKIKENGDRAINYLAETIRNAEKIVCYGGDETGVDKIVIRTMAGKYTKLRFVDPVTSGTAVTQNGYIAKQEDLNPTDETTLCTTTFVTPPEVIITNNNSTNNNSTLGISVSDGQFVRISGSNSKDTVTILFYANNNLTAKTANSSDSVYFQTTVQVR